MITNQLGFASGFFVSNNGGPGNSDFNGLNLPSLPNHLTWCRPRRKGSCFPVQPQADTVKYQSILE